MMPRYKLLHFNAISKNVLIDDIIKRKSPAIVSRVWHTQMQNDERDPTI